MNSRALSMTSRIIAAILGGYAFTYAFTAALARLLPLPAIDALVISTLLSFAIYTAAILWAFMTPRVWKVWAVFSWAVPLYGIGFWPQWMGN